MLVTLITEKEFLKRKKTAAPDYLIRNKALVKKDSTITIGGQKFRDGYGEGHQPNIYSYIGEYKKLNAYLLEYMCSACEEYNYELIDKTTGEEISSFTNIPVFSKNFEFVIDLGQLFSNSPTILNIYKWKDHDGYMQNTYKEFANWSPIGDGFWGADNCYYIAVMPTLTAERYRGKEMKSRKKAHYNYRYIKIQVKAPTVKEEGY
ncbi:hypothetical protein [Flavobacterium rhizosphaerae]|uniref:Uncharacterized protein n=1 Tax=Flavobacterium rhizosphaerae TaxID=3163298 RepID=A0ABW8YVT6_9FLAO